MSALWGTALHYRWRILIAFALVGAVIVVLATRGAAAEGTNYRTAQVVSGDVTQTLTSTGSVSSASRTDLSFQIDGTVDEVPVAAGDTVAAGDILATLDVDDLNDAVAAAQESLTAAEDTLAENLEAQASGTAIESTTGSSGTGSTVSAAAFVIATLPTETLSVSAVSDISDEPDAAGPATADDESAGAVESARAELVAAQTVLLDAYAAAQIQISAFADAAELAQTECAALIDAGAEDTADADDAEAETDAQGDEGDADESTAQQKLEACQDATAAALAAQQLSLDAQQATVDAATSLDAAVTALLSAVDDALAAVDEGGAAPDTQAPDTQAPDTVVPETQSPTDTAPDASSDGAANGGGGSQQGADSNESAAPSGTDGAADAERSTSQEAATGSSGGSVPSAADILAYQAKVTAAQAALSVAEQQVEYATLTAPVAGTVVAVGFTTGQSVSGDGSVTITLVADNTYLVQLAVGLESARLLEVGQTAELTLVADGQVAQGVVSSVSSVNTGNAFSASYAVTIAVADPGFEIRIGAATRMQITVADASDVLVVPTSAVSDSLGDATVLVAGDDGLPQSTAIEAGAVGSKYTEVRSGLEAGQEVILADLTEALTSGDSESSDSSGLLGGLGETDTTEVQGPGVAGFNPGGREGAGRG